MSCYLADYLKEIGHIPLGLEETKPDDELLKQVEEMKRGLNRET